MTYNLPISGATDFKENLKGLQKSSTPKKRSSPKVGGDSQITKKIRKPCPSSVSKTRPKKNVKKEHVTSTIKNLSAKQIKDGGTFEKCEMIDLRYLL